MTQSPEQPDVPVKPRGHHVIDIMISLLLLAAVVALVVFGLQGFRTQQLQFRIQQDWLRGQQAGQSLLQGVMVTNQRALVKLLRSTQSPEEEWALAEAHYLLQLASINAAVLHDVPAAMALLVAADGAMKTLKSPAWLPVRRAVEKDLVALRAVPQVNVVKLVEQLDVLSRQIPNLALLPSQTKSAAPATATQTSSDAAQSMWNKGVSAGLQTLKSAVVIKRHQQAVQSLLPDEQRLYLVQNIQIRLAAAQWAILHQQDTVYQDNLTAASDLITKYFNQNIALTQRTLSSISALQKVRLQQKMPNISASLNALDAAVAQRAKQSR